MAGVAYLCHKVTQYVEMHKINKNQVVMYVYLYCNCLEKLKQ